MYQSTYQYKYILYDIRNYTYTYIYKYMYMYFKNKKGSKWMLPYLYYCDSLSRPLMFNPGSFFSSLFSFTEKFSLCVRNA